MRAAGFSPDVALYNKLIDSCTLDAKTRWKYAKRFLLDASTNTGKDKSSSSLSAFTTGKALSAILSGSTQSTFAVTETGTAYIRPGAVLHAKEVIRTWNELQKVMGRKSESISSDPTFPFYNVKAVTSHTVSPLGLSVSSFV